MWGGPALVVGQVDVCRYLWVRDLEMEVKEKCTSMTRDTAYCRVNVRDFTLGGITLR